MAKKLISVWLSLTILLTSSISIIYADEIISGGFFLKNIVINGENIVNYELSNPVLLYKDRVYLPMDTTLGQICGFEANMDNESRTLTILKTEPVRKNLADKSRKNNLDAQTVSVRYDINVAVQTEAQNKDASLTGEQASATASDQSTSPEERLSAIESAIDGTNVLDAIVDRESLQLIAQQSIAAKAAAEPEYSVTQIDLKGQPVLVKKEIVYVPLNAIVSSETLGWSSYYDFYAGEYISTDNEIDAASYFNADTSRYYKGLSAYIVKKNPKLKMSQALEMVKYFEAYGQIYGVDLKLLMSMAESESTFTSNIVNKYNCCGLMQIKVSTGAAYGFTKAQLLQVKPNIQMGAMHVGDCIATFGGDVTLGISGYANGIYAVKKGKYTTSYANKVLKRANGIASFVNSYAG